MKSVLIGLISLVLLIFGFVSLVDCVEDKIINETAIHNDGVDKMSSTSSPIVYRNGEKGLKQLSRKKRYIAFPEGSSFSVYIYIYNVD